MARFSRRGWTLTGALVLLFGVLFIGATRVRPEQPATPAAPPTAAEAEPAPDPGHPAPPIALQTSDGRSIALADHAGDVVLINIWATWCPPCRSEMPAIQATYERYRDRGFVVLAVNQRETPEQVAAFMAEHELTFPALLDRDGVVSAAYRANVLPSSFFVDRRGEVRAVYRGPMPRSVIDGTVERLLAEER